MRAQRSGFTLIELLVVMVIVAVLAGFGMTRFWSVRTRAHISAVQNDLRTLAVHQETYFHGQYSYAASIDLLETFEPSDGVTISINYAAADGWGATAAHAGAVGRQCGIFQPAAPDTSGEPSTAPGVIMCN